MMIKNILYMVAAGTFLFSCKAKTANTLNYMQNVEQIATEASAKNAKTTIQKGDRLDIFVSSKNMEVVKPFNQSYYTYQTPAMAETTNVGKSYLVDSNGDIDYPILGTLSTTDKTPQEFKEMLASRISTFVKNPTVTVNLANFKVSILGEVARPAQYTIPEGQGTLLNAIALAGDLTIYAKRNDLLLVRNQDGVITKHRIDLMDANFINSPYYQLKQNDVIYVSGNETKEKVARLDPNTGTYIAIAGTIVGLAGIFITIFKK